MSAWDSVVGFGERALGIGAEFGAHALEATPLVGAIPAIGHAMVHSSRATDARWDAQMYAGDEARVAHDHDVESYNRREQGVDMMHAIPVLGAGLEVGELIAGGYSALTGGGFEEGMERQRDSEADLGRLMAGHDECDTTALRHRLEEHGDAT
jgi:hypothetical protein